MLNYQKHLILIWKVNKIFLLFKSRKKYFFLLETFFLRALKMNLNDGDIIVIASFDEITYGFVTKLRIKMKIIIMYFRLKEASLSILESYGSQLIKIIKFRDSFVMIGQKGLARGKAIEMVGFSLSVRLHENICILSFCSLWVYEIFCSGNSKI